MLKIEQITMRYGNTFRVLIEANDYIKEKWLEKVNEGLDDDDKLSYEEAINDEYFYDKEGNLYVEVDEVELNPLDKNYAVVYFFDNYEQLDVKLTNEELMQIKKYINRYKHIIPDNEDLGLGDAEYEDYLTEMNIQW